ncbi:MAG: AraC family transcriptional regulator [Oscillospiraceae bacterium]|nr:AraC family transcriptional regulator [Oscillospiraceae bacterium]
MQQNNIQYISDEKTGTELILCSDSVISYPLHNHVSVITAGVVLQGAVTITVRNTDKIYKENDAFIIYPYVPHSIHSDNKYTLLTLCINKNTSEKFTEKVIRNNIKDLSKNLSSPANFNVRKILSHFDNAHIYRPENINSDIYIKRLKTAIETTPENPFTLDEMATNALISKYRFIGKFKAQIGLTPHRFCLQNRIRKAKRLIRSNSALTEAALAAGFFDQSHFIKEFKKFTGLTPLDYKNSCRIISS